MNSACFPKQEYRVAQADQRQVSSERVASYDDVPLLHTFSNEVSHLVLVCPRHGLRFRVCKAN